MLQNCHEFNSGRFGSRSGEDQENLYFPISSLSWRRALSTLLTNGLANKTISGIALSKHDLRLNHPFFADDFMLFTKASKQEANYEVAKALNTYSKASG